MYMHNYLLEIATVGMREGMALGVPGVHET